jgi:glycerate kinase
VYLPIFRFTHYFRSPEMKIVIAPDSFKGSLTALQVAEAMEVGLRRVFPDATIEKVPMADGGEGTVQSLVDATDGEILTAQVMDPLGNTIDAQYGVLGDGVTAVIEMAEASGLTLVPLDKRDPRVTTTYGTGELIRSALAHGCRKLIIGIGGSATNDGGTGMAQALGAKLLTASSEQIKPGGGHLGTLNSIDLSELDPRITETETVVACDVNNPLTGEQGASYVYGPQKGATREMIEMLDANLAHFDKILQRDLSKSVGNVPGAGAAGGLGAGLMAFVDASLKSGIEIVTEAAQLSKRLADADLVITGEGQINFQTVFGKTPVGVATVAKTHNIPVIAIAGSIADDSDGVYDAGIDAMIDIVPEPMPLETAIENATALTEIAAERAGRMVAAGIKIKRD